MMSKNIFSKEKFYSRIAFELIILLLISFVLCILIFNGNLNNNGIFSFNRNRKTVENSQQLTDLENSFGEIQTIIESPRFSRNTKPASSSSSIDEHIFKTKDFKTLELSQSTTENTAAQTVSFKNAHTNSFLDQPYTEIHWDKDFEKQTENEPDHNIIIDNVFPSKNVVPSEPIMWEGSGGYDDDFDNYRPVQLTFPNKIIANESETKLFETTTEKSQPNWLDKTTEYFLNAETFKRPYRRQDHKHYFEIFDTDFSTTESLTPTVFKKDLAQTQEETTIPTEIIELSYYINGNDIPKVLEQTSTPPKNIQIQNYELPNVKNDLFETQLYNHETTTTESVYHQTIPSIKKPIDHLNNFMEQKSNHLDTIDSNDIADDNMVIVPKKHLLKSSSTVKPFNFFFKDFHKPNPYERMNFWNIFKPNFYHNNDLTMSQSRPKAAHRHPFLNALKLEGFLPQDNNARYEVENYSNILNKNKKSMMPFESRSTESTIQEVENFHNIVNVFGKPDSYLMDTFKAGHQTPLGKLVHLFDNNKSPCRNHGSLFRFK